MCVWGICVHVCVHSPHFHSSQENGVWTHLFNLKESLALVIDCDYIQLAFQWRESPSGPFPQEGKQDPMERWEWKGLSQLPAPRRPGPALEPSSYQSAGDLGQRHTCFCLFFLFILMGPPPIAPCNIPHHCPPYSGTSLCPWAKTQEGGHGDRQAGDLVSGLRLLIKHRLNWTLRSRWKRRKSNRLEPFLLGRELAGC